jgi:tetratricopeptide (TPR) repeat protein
MSAEGEAALDHAVVEWGFAELMLGRYDAASELFHRASSSNPNDWYILAECSARLVTAALAQKDIRVRKRLAVESMVYAERSSKIVPTNGSVLSTIGRAAGILGRYEKSLDAFDRYFAGFSGDELGTRITRAMSEDPFAPASVLGITIAFVGLGRYSEGSDCQAVFERLQDLNAAALADYASQLYFFGTVSLNFALREKLAGLARRPAERAAEMEPSDMANIRTVGGSAFYSREFARSAAVLNRYVARVPNDADAFFMLGISLLALREFDGAIAALSRCHTLYPTLWATRVYIARSYFYKGQWARAVACLLSGK